MLKISLLHATYMSDSDPLGHRDRWLDFAEHPSRIDYVFAMDEHDVKAIASTHGATRVVTTPLDPFSTAVQNWNAAAELATGDLLFVISDDLLPQPGWDSALEQIVADHDPQITTFAVKVQDSPYPADTTLRHPAVSRAFYRKFGLFDRNFRGVFCDNDITMRAYLFSRILDGRSVMFSHAHPHFDPEVTETASHAKINAPEEYDLGREVFRTKFSPIHLGLTLNRLRLPSPTLRHWIDITVRKTLLAILKPPRKARVASKKGSAE